MNRNSVGKIVISAFGILLSILWVSPFYLVLVNSFKTKKEIFTDTIGLPGKFLVENYKKAAADLKILESFSNSVLIAAVSIILLLVFTSMAAYALQRNKRKSSTVIFLIFAVAMLIPFQSVMIPLIAQFGAIRMLNRIGLVFMYMGFGSSLAIFLYHGSLKSIPQSLDEAALMDGCGRSRTFWKIIFPMLKPTTVTIVVLDIIWIWNDYLLPSLVINKAGMRTIPLMTFYFFGQYTKQWNLAMAGLTIAIIPVVVFYFLAQKQIINGIISGAIRQ